MRIISGYLKGKKIDLPKDDLTRPLKDMVKESIFNVLEHSKEINFRVKNSLVLDLFSGSGSFGLECLSRGAKQITFVEKDRKIAEILYENLSNFNVLDKAEIKNEKIINFLKEKSKNKFEIIFMDPPFAEISYLQELKMIKEKKFYKKKHIVIIHRESTSNDAYKEYLNPLIIKKYGRSKIIIGRF